MPDAGQTHGIHDIHIAVLKELVTTGMGNGTELVNGSLHSLALPWLAVQCVTLRSQFTGSTI